MDLQDFCTIVGNEDMSRQYLRANNLLPDAPACTEAACQAGNIRMRLNMHRNDRPSRHVWRCPNCRKTLSERAGSFFEDSNISFSKALALLHFWSHNLSVKTTCALVQLTKKTVIKFHKKLRLLCAWWLRENPRQIGGQTNRGRRLIVEIDEAMLAKRKNNQGRVIAKRWIFGGYCQETREGFMMFVPRRNAVTLIPLIIRHIQHGSMIFSDEWKGTTHK